MLQIILEPNDSYSLGEMAQMAVEGGCSWLQLNAKDIDGSELRDIIPEIATLCRESGTMLTVEGRADIAKEFGLHGVFIPLETVSPIKVREELGAEAVIGAEIGSAESALMLSKADIDYVVASHKVDDCQKLIDDIRNAGCKIPVVALSDDFTEPSIRNLMGIGFSGICARNTIFSAKDPVANIEQLITLLNSLR